jgi:uncharacterized oxidoreductase
MIMNTQNKKILITGGGTGIGFSIAKAFAGNGNRLILVGRREEKLKEAVAKLPQTSYLVADVTNEKDVVKIAQYVKNFGGLDILVNNAGSANPQQLDAPAGIYEKAKFEMELNYLSVLRLTEQLLPFLKESKEAAIINIESIVSYLPNANIATYSATKAALHSYSQSLRLVLEKSNPHIKVYEVFPPFVDTDLTKGFDADKLSPDEVAQDLINALAKEEYAVRNGQTKELYKHFHQAPELALKALNGIEN